MTRAGPMTLPDGAMTSAQLLEKRSVSLAGHRTSVALEPEFWAAVERLAADRKLSVSAFVVQVDRTRGLRNLASAIRVAVLIALQQGGAL